jgi:lysophospholipase L1-like esterase
VHRIANVALVVLAIAVFGTAGYVLTHSDAPPSDGTSVPTEALPLTSATPPPSPSPSPSPEPSAPAASSSSSRKRVVVAFLGDDWTSGVGASRKSVRFTTVLSKALDLRERNFGADRTGYAASSSTDGAYATRVSDVVAARPDVVVVSGGRNDVVDDETDAGDKARQLFDILHAELPDAELVAVAPWWGDSRPPAELAALAVAVESAVTVVGGTYLDVADPIRGHPGYMADAGDPNDQGYAALAAALEPRLRVLVTSG